MSSGEVILRSADGAEFVVSRSVAALSGTVAATLEKMKKGGGGGSSSASADEPAVVHLREVSANVLDAVVTYLNVQAGAGDSEEAQKMYEEEFLGGETEMGWMLDAVLGANSLEVQGLLDVLSGRIAARMKDKSVEWVRRVFELPDDIPAADVAAHVAEYGWAFEGVDQDD